MPLHASDFPAISLTWQVCPDGVEVVEVEATSKESALTLVAGTLGGREFRYCSAKRVSKELVVQNLESPLIVKFANAATDGQLIDFFSRYGLLLAYDGLHVDAARDRRLEIIKAMHLRLGQAKDSQRTVSWLNKVLSRVDLVPIAYLTPSRSMAIQLRPKSLFHLMVMEIAFGIGHEVNLHSCDQCGDYFLTGATTGRRGTAIFCSDKCRVKAHRNKARGA